MLKTYFKVALRTLFRRKGYTLLNSAGLGVGMAGFLLIALYVWDETHYDRFHEHGADLYRVLAPPSGTTQAQLAPTMRDEVPGVLNTARLFRAFNKATLEVDADTKFNETLYVADSTFFTLFSLDFIYGEARTALHRPDALVLTETTARRYFGEANPMGRQVIAKDILGKGPFPLVVTGVIRDIPHHSHLQFDLLTSFQLIEDMWFWMDNWSTRWVYTYVHLAKDAEPAYLGPRLQALITRHTEQQTPPRIRLQALHDIHLHSADVTQDIGPQGDLPSVVTLSVVAVLLLLIACINFINLTTARATVRAKEIGMRKVLGAHRRQLINQFMGEAFLLTVPALGVALGLLLVVLPGFEAFTGKHFSFGLKQIGPILLGLVGTLIVVGTGAGLYPALFLSRHRPLAALRAQSGHRAEGLWLRKGLVVFQFTASVILIVGTLVILRQTDYVKRKPLGFDSEQVLTIPFGTVLTERIEVLRSELSAHPGVLGVSAARSVPGVGVQTWFFRPEGVTTPLEELPRWGVFSGDHAYPSILGVQRTAGRFFSQDLASDSNAFLLNEAAVASAIALAGEAWRDPIGKSIEMYVAGTEGFTLNQRGTIIGVIEDFHVRSLHSPIEPLAIRVVPDFHDDLFIRIDTKAAPEVLAYLRQQWKALSIDRPFDYTFLDAYYDAFYRSEERLGQLFGVFSGLAVFVGCLGLIGLTAFTTEQRKKEVGVRKVLGATVPDLMFLLSKEYLLLVGLAFVVAVPVAYFALDAWLQAFAYRITVSPTFFLLAGVGVLALAFLTVSYQTLRAALANPAQVLRHD